MDKVLKIYSRIVLMFLPFFFLPFIYDGFGLGKSSFLLLSGVIGLVLWVILLLSEKKVEVKYSKWFLWITILFVWALISFWKMSAGGQARSLASGLGIGTLAGLFLWSFLWLQIRSEKEAKKQMTVLTFSGLIVGLVSLVVFMIPASRLPMLFPKNNPLISISASWTVVGSLLGEVVLFLFLFMFWVRKLMAKVKGKAEFGAYFKELLSTAFFALMLFLGIYRLIKVGWVYLDLNSAWVIAVEALKNSPIFGVGLGNFVEAFSRFRPVSFNLTPMWSNTFGVSSLGILNIWTELGSVGLLIVGLMTNMVWRSRKDVAFKQMLCLGLLALILPPTFIVFVMLFWVASSSFGEVKKAKLILNVGEKGFNIMPYLASILLLGIFGFAGYKMTRVVMADYYWRQSLVATSKNDGSGAYNNQIKAIATNPNLADYRAVYAQTNLALAQNFLNVEEGQEVSDENKEKASTLIQQSVREAQAAVSLDQKISAYWTNLGSVYRSLVGVVDGTLDWSVQSYQQAAVVDPVNPGIYMELGSMMYGAEAYDSAERYFEEAVTNKQDYANAWYNWAYAAKQQDKLQLAVNRMEQALALVPADSEDYTSAKEEFDKWVEEYNKAVEQYNQQLKEQQQAQEQQTQENGDETTNQEMVTEPLTTPEPLPTMGEEGQVNVPAEELALPTEEVME